MQSCVWSASQIPRVSETVNMQSTTLKTLFTVILVLMSLAAGAAKVMRVPDEVQFFSDAGLGLGVVVIFGIFQILGALMLALPQSRPAGAVMVCVGLLASSVLLFINGNVQFGLFSMLPVIMAGYIVYSIFKATPTSSADA